MDDIDELAFFDYLGAREAALAAAVGYFVTDNIPTERLRVIAANTANESIALAARIVIHQRKKEGPP